MSLEADEPDDGQPDEGVDAPAQAARFKGRAHCQALSLRNAPSLKRGLIPLPASTLCLLRTSSPARGGEGTKVLPGPRPRPELKPFRTGGLVRRVTPLLIIAALIAVQAAADVSPVLVFPLYLGAVLLAALFLGPADSLGAGV